MPFERLDAREGRLAALRLARHHAAHRLEQDLARRAVVERPPSRVRVRPLPEVRLHVLAVPVLAPRDVDLLAAHHNHLLPVQRLLRDDRRQRPRRCPLPSTTIGPENILMFLSNSHRGGARLRVRTKTDPTQALAAQFAMPPLAQGRGLWRPRNVHGTERLTLNCSSGQMCVSGSKFARGRCNHQRDSLLSSGVSGSMGRRRRRGKIVRVLSMI